MIQSINMYAYHAGNRRSPGLSCGAIVRSELVGFTNRLFPCYTGTGSDWVKCLLGTYSNLTGLMMESECLPCPGGQYCDTPGITEPSGNCSAGKSDAYLLSVCLD